MEFLIHQGIKCNKCQKLPIVGIRFKCLQCKSYNLCEDCENKYGKNHGHTLLKLRNNQQINMVLDKYNIKEKTMKLKAKPVEKPSCKCMNTSMKFKTVNNNNCINIPVKLNNNGKCKWPLPCFFTCEENSLVKGNRVKIWKITGQPGENVEFNIKIDLSKVKRTSEYPSVWLNNKLTSDEKLVYKTTKMGSLFADFSTSKNYVRPIICVKRGLIISGGEVTKSNPLVIGDKNEIEN